MTSQEELAATERLLTIEDIQSILQISRASAYKLADPARVADPIPSVALSPPGGRQLRRFRRQDVDAWIARRAGQGPLSER